MCHLPIITMACGHPEIANIPVLCAVGTEYETICLPFLELGVDETNACSGEMCEHCQVDLGDMLDSLVVDVEGAQASTDQQPMMSGGLDADTIEENSEAALVSERYDIDGSRGAGTAHSQYMMSGGVFGDELKNISEDTAVEPGSTDDVDMTDEEEDRFEELFLKEMSQSNSSMNANRMLQLQAHQAEIPASQLLGLYITVTGI